MIEYKERNEDSPFSTSKIKDVLSKNKQDKINEARFYKITIDQIGDDSINSLGAIIRLISLAENNKLEIFNDDELVRNIHVQYLKSTIKITKLSLIRLLELLSEKHFDAKEELFDKYMIIDIFKNICNINSDESVPGECKIIENLFNTGIIIPFDFITQINNIIESALTRTRLFSPNSSKLVFHAEALFALSKFLLSVQRNFNSFNEFSPENEVCNIKMEMIHKLFDTVQKIINNTLKVNSIVHYSLGARVVSELVYTADDDQIIMFDGLLSRIFQIIFETSSSPNSDYVQYDLLNAARNLTSVNDEFVFNSIDPEFIILLMEVNYCNSHCLKLAIKIIYNIACINTDVFHPTIISILCNLNQKVVEQTYEVKKAFTKLLTCLLQAPGNLLKIHKECYENASTEKFNIVQYFALNIFDNPNMSYDILRSIRIMAIFSFNNEESEFSELFEQNILTQEVQQCMCEIAEGDDVKASELAIKLIDALFCEEES